MNKAAVVRIGTSALGLAMLFGSATWAAGKAETLPDLGTHVAQPGASASSDCHAEAPRVILFNAVMQPPGSTCRSAGKPRINNAHAPQGTHRSLSGQPLSWSDENVRYSF